MSIKLLLLFISLPFKLSYQGLLYPVLLLDASDSLVKIRFRKEISIHLLLFESIIFLLIVPYSSPTPLLEYELELIFLLVLLLLPPLFATTITVRLTTFRELGSDASGIMGVVVFLLSPLIYCLDNVLTSLNLLLITDLLYILPYR